MILLSCFSDAFFFLKGRMSAIRELYSGIFYNLTIAYCEYRHLTTIVIGTGRRVYLVYNIKTKSIGSRTDSRVTFLARPRNVTQRRRPSSQARIKGIRVPSLLLISVAAAELA